ncbi:acyl carrier protein [Sandaracinus amylolyticus]|uniref:acyl carrier protein n=1 Tax=Sandaracinus amylolyticus TaxID=927083 RepID=UPI001F46F50E|nr:acyl carrier protein [Sandaracinus amylolyticus]UJR78425.1 Hypothetical protein I5071_4520 [Sandaracinus amylolyticus]
MKRNAQVAEELERFVRERFQVRGDDVTFSRSVHLFEEGYVDSTGLVELIGHLEATFGVHVPEDAIFDPSFSSIDGIAKVIGALRSGSMEAA